MSVRAESDQLHELIDESAKVEQIGTGFTFTEGPIWNPEGAFLLFSDMPGTLVAAGTSRAECAWWRARATRATA